MKLVLLFLFNIVFPDILSDWLAVNQNIINSGLYKISFHQKDESIIENAIYSQLDTSANLIIFDKKIRYETQDRIVIFNKDSSMILNKKYNQLFIDEADNNSKMLINIDLAKILYSSYFNDGCYDVKYQNIFSSKICFDDLGDPVFKIFNQNMNIELSNIKLDQLDSLNAKNSFEIENKLLSVFDLRIK